MRQPASTKMRSRQQRLQLWHEDEGCRLFFFFGCGSSMPRKSSTSARSSSDNRDARLETFF